MMRLTMACNRASSNAGLRAGVCAGRDVAAQTFMSEEDEEEDWICTLNTVTRAQIRAWYVVVVDVAGSSPGSKVRLHAGMTGLQN